MLSSLKLYLCKELHATWLPVQYQFDNQTSVYNMVKELTTIGINRVYVDVWNQGKLYFKSDTMDNFVNNGEGTSDDYLLWTLEAAQKINQENNNIDEIEVFAWFEYGLIAAYGSINNDFAREAEQKGWILGQEGQGFVWMDPDNSDVLSFLVNIMNDCWINYSSQFQNFKGLQLDDHFSSPVSLGKTKESMDNAMKYLNENLKFNNNMLLSLSPSTLSQALNTYNVDWNYWGNNDWYREVIPQLYRSTYEDYKSILDITYNSVSDKTKQYFVASGIRVDGSGEPTSWKDVAAMIELTSSPLYNNMGESIWYARGIIELYPTQFKHIWG